MSKLVHIITVILMAPVLLPGLGPSTLLWADSSLPRDEESYRPAGGEKKAHRRDPSKVPGSKVRQLLLKQALEKRLSGTLVAELSHNKKLWGSLAPEQLRNLRERYYAFLQQDSDSQVALMKAAEKFHKLSEQQRQAYLKRSAWLKKVIARLSPAEREALRKLPPAERAKRLLELKAKFVDSQPASRPTTQPAATTEK